MPGQAKIVSVTMANAMMPPNSTPTTVTIGNHDVLQHMHRDDAALGQPLGARELDEIERHVLAHAAAGQPDDQGDA